MVIIAAASNVIGCTNMSTQEQGTVSGAAIVGAVGGAGIASVAGGSAWTALAIGAAADGVAGSLKCSQRYSQGISG